ncbi:MAG TPA: dihydroneopterin aldolase [Patescibacteria group bacterium]|nr:dihydroneopterin aldolase [Patescibacteria group bacterium]
MRKITDKIFIDQLIVPCIVGLFEHERKQKQDLIISVTLSVNTKKSGKTDDINDTVNYHDLAIEIEKTVGNSAYQLIEKVAQVVANICLTDKRVQEVTVKIEKPRAITNAKSSAIEITRSNE